MNTDIAAYFKFDLNLKAHSDLKSPFKDSNIFKRTFHILTTDILRINPQIWTYSKA